MLNSFTIGSYYSVDSKIHHLHPLTKIICSLLAIISVVNTNSYIYVLILIALFCGIIYLSKIPFKYFTKAIISAKYFLLSILIINIIFSGSIISGVFIILKMLLIIIISSILLFTTKIDEMIKGLQLFLRPLNILKISSDKVALSLVLSIHFVPILLEQANHIIKAQSSRGLNFSELSIKDKLKSFKVILFPMFSISLKKADIIADALQVRHFNYNKKRSSIHFYKMTFCDIITILFFLNLLVFSFI